MISHKNEEDNSRSGKEDEMENHGDIKGRERER